MNIPEPKRDGPLISRLFAVILVGFDKVMDKESQLFLRQLSRLVDKAFSEYILVRSLVQDEIKTQDKLVNRIEIINHLENCINAASGVSKILHRLENGLDKENKGKRKDLTIFRYISDVIKNEGSGSKLWEVRNTIEHIDKEIYSGTFRDQLFVDFSDNYQYIGINGKNILVDDLVDTLTSYHNVSLEIYNKLPYKYENGKYYYEQNKAGLEDVQ